MLRESNWRKQKGKEKGILNLKNLTECTGQLMEDLLMKHLMYGPHILRKYFVIFFEIIKWLSPLKSHSFRSYRSWIWPNNLNSLCWLCMATWTDIHTYQVLYYDWSTGVWRLSDSSGSFGMTHVHLPLYSVRYWAREFSSSLFSL